MTGLVFNDRPDLPRETRRWLRAVEHRLRTTGRATLAPAQLAGWKAYRVEVGPRERLHARLRALHEAWFVVKVENRWGQLEEGMLRSTLATSNPETTYENPKDQPATIFLVVDTTETGADQEPYRLQINRP